MLYLDEPTRIGRLDIYRDFNKKSLFYYMPSSPGIAVEGGQPLFNLLVIQDEDDSGASDGTGFLTMTADLKVSDGALDDARRELSRRFGVQAELAPVQVQSGAVKVSALGTSTGDETSGRFIEKIIAHSTPSLYGDQRAVFSAELTQDGAAVLAQSFQDDGATPVMLTYELTILGLLPAYECKIVIDFDQSYNYLKTRTTFASLMFQADVEAEMEELERNGSIKIEEIVYHTDDPEARQKRLGELKTLARELAQWTFFKPGLNPGAVLAQNVRDLHAERDTSAGNLGRTSAFHRMMTGTGGSATRAPAAPAVAGAQSNGERVSGSQAQPAPTTPATDSPAEQPAEDNTNDAVEAWNAAGRPNATYQLKEIRQRERQHIEFELSQVSATTRTIAPQGQLRLIPSLRNRANIQFVTTDHDFFKRIEGTVANEADLAALGVKSMNVKVLYGENENGTGPKDEEDFELDAVEEKSYGFFRDHNGSRELSYKVTVNYKPDSAIGNRSSSATTELVTTTDRHIEIDPRVAGAFSVVDVQAASVDWAMVKQIQAVVVYEDTSGEFNDQTTVILTQGDPAKSILVRPRNPRDEIKVNATFMYTDGSDDLVTQSRAGSGPVVLNQPNDSTHKVDVTLLDPLSRYQRVMVAFDRSEDGSDPAARTAELTGHMSRADWSFRPENNDRSYRYQVTYLMDGPVREEPWIRTDETTLLLGDQIAGILKIEVVLLSDLANAGMRALRIKLRYPDAPEWADPDFEKTLKANEPLDPIIWQAPMNDARKTDYEVELQWFRENGERVTLGPVSQNSETLLLDPATPEEIL